MIPVSSRYIAVVVRGALRYAVAAFALLLSYVVVVGAIRGGNLASLGYGLFEFLWFGWIYVLAGLPAAIAFLVVLYGWLPRIGPPTRLRIVVLSVGIWSLAGAVLAVVLAALRLLPDTPTLGGLVETELYVAAWGAMLGMVEVLRGPIPGVTRSRDTAAR
jgi:hypothetical protein